MRRAVRHGPGGEIEARPVARAMPAASLTSVFEFVVHAGGGGLVSGAAVPVSVGPLVLLSSGPLPPESCGCTTVPESWGAVTVPESWPVAGIPYRLPKLRRCPP